MPGRTRRVRLLAAILCIVTVFFLYERKTAPVQRYADYIKQSTVGGGAVLRKPEVDGSQQDPIAESRPAPPPEPTTAPDKVFGPEPPTTATSTPPQWPTSSPEPTLAPTSTSSELVWLAHGELPVQVDQGRLDDDEIYQGLDSAVYSPVHWSKQTEHFPVTSTIQLPTGKPSSIPLIQKQGRGRADVERLGAIKEAAKHAWKGFREEGWDYDEVRPVSGGGTNSFNGWGATLVDSLDTLWIMGMKEEFEEAVKKAAQIDFTTSSRSDIPLFEVTIRYLGGLIAAYDVSGKQYRVLLDKAVELAEVLYGAFDTPNRVPETYYYWKPAFASNPHRASGRIVMAEIGTLSLEFTRLAQLTGEPKYYDAIARLTDLFQEWQNNTRLPGMWPTMLDGSGCMKPVRLAPSSTYQQRIPVPNGDTYMVKSEPVQLEKEVVDAAEAQLAQYRTKDEDPMGSVANPMIANPLVAEADSSLRHPMPDHPDNSQREGEGEFKAASSGGLGDPLRETVDDNPLNREAGGGSSFRQPDRPTEERKGSEAAANRPLAHIVGSGSDDLGPTPQEAQRENGPSSPFDARTLRKRQLEDFDEVNEPPVNSTASTNTSTQPGLDQLADAETSKEPDCVPQGLASTSKNGQESFTLGGQSDSTYEYLPKEYLLLGGLVPQYKDMYLASMKPVIDKLVYRPMTEDERDILIAGDLRIGVNYTTGEYIEDHQPKGEHLTCFAGGMLAMGGKIFNMPEHIEIGRKLTDGCIWTYNITNSGIMPESFHMAACEDATDCKWNVTKWHDELDPYAEFRDEQRETFKEQYEIDDLEAYEEKLAQESAAASASEAATLAAQTAAPGLGDIEDANTFAHDEPDLSKQRERRDQNDISFAPSEEDGRQAAPQPAPQEMPTTTIDSDPNDLWNGLASDQFEEDYEQPSGTEPVALYTPAPPPTHEHYVLSKIANERLPPGFTRLDSRGYILRPEAIESVFYLYRITGEQHWRDMGWNMFVSVEKATRAPYGHSSIDDVTKTHPETTDKMESFWLAETLKYFYLLFDDPAEWSLDEWVLNTEAHFFRRPMNPASVEA